MVGTTECEVGDTRTPGLSVRVRKTAATWTLRGRLGPKLTTWRVGDLATLSDPKEARDRAHEARRMLSRGLDPAEYLRSQEAGGPVVRHFDQARDGWAWPEACVAFLQHIQENRSPKTHEDYRKTLNAPGLRAKWDNKLLKNIVASDIRKVTEAIAGAGKPSQANHVLRVVKSLMSWATQQDGSGIADTPSQAIVVRPKEYKSAPGHVPTLAELGGLFWRLDDVQAHPTARLAAALLVLTAQRRETVASARLADLAADPERPGWGMWRMEADPQLQRDRPHAIPLPPLAWGIVESARRMAGNSGWLFPQARMRSMERGAEGHMHAKTIYEALKEAGQGITPHDIRRALATHGPDHLGTTDSETKKILHHAEGRGGDVTGRHYAFHESIPAKARVMESWERFLVGLMVRHRPAAREWPGFLPPCPELVGRAAGSGLPLKFAQIRKLPLRDTLLR
ncbi:MAG: site-specific integrase [Hymenobacter sp.]